MSSETVTSKKRKRTLDPAEELERARAREELLNRPRVEAQKRVKICSLRLEKIIAVAKSRPFEEISKSLTDMEKKNILEVKELESTYEAKIALLTDETSIIREKIADTRHKIEGLQETKGNFDFKVPTKNEACKEYQRSMDILSGQLTDNSVALVRLEEKTQAVQSNLERVQEERDVLKLAVKNACASAARVTKQALKAQSRARIGQEDLDLLLAKTGAEIEDLNEQLTKLGNSPEQLEEALREAFQEQLDLIITERRRQFKEENAEGMRELEIRYDSKWIEYGAQVKENEEANDRLKAKLEGIREEIKDQRSVTAPSIRLGKAIKMAKGFEDDIKEANVRWSTLASKNKAMLESLRATRNKKDREYDDLMDLKVALAMEIKAYSGLLENEEDRLGYVSPTKHRKLQPIPS